MMAHSLITLPVQTSDHKREDRLDSWKEVACYLRREVRTVQHWEKNEGLPIRRHFHNRISTVYAFREEIDNWWASRCSRLHCADHTEPPWKTKGSSLDTLRKVKLGIVGFVNAGSDAKSAMFTEALSDELVMALSGSSKGLLTIMSLPTATARKVSAKLAATQSKSTLGVEFILRGSVTCFMDRARVYAHLLQISDKSYLWSERYDVPITDMFSTQHEVASRIANSIRLKLLSA